jgi:hypothetical protein
MGFSGVERLAYPSHTFLFVIPAQAGIQPFVQIAMICLKKQRPDPGLRRDDEQKDSVRGNYRS